LAGKNYHYYNKKGIKLSIITDSQGIPFFIKIFSGNDNDAKLFKEHFLEINKTQLDKNFNNSIFVADPGYDSSIVRNLLMPHFKQLIIDYNNRNTKDKKKIKKLNNEDKKIYRKRSIIERMFSKIKQYRRFLFVYEKKSTYFLNFIYLSLIDIILKLYFF
jgi:transposase